MVSRVFIGCGAGFAGDRTDAAAPVVRALAECDGPRYIIYETLAERTLALAQAARSSSSGPGYNPVLAKFIRPILRDCLAAGIKIVGNFGAAIPKAAAYRTAELARELRCGRLKIAFVEGDDITNRLSPAEFAQ